MVAYTGGPLVVEGWSLPVVVDLAGLEIPRQQIPIRLQHDERAGVGHTTRVWHDGQALYAEGMISRKTLAAREVVESAKAGFPWQASIGVRVEASRRLGERNTMTVNGRAVEGPVILATKATLGKISFVDMGADINTQVTVLAKGATMDDKQVVSQEGAHEPVSEVARVEAIRAIFGGKHPAVEAKAIGDGVPVEEARKMYEREELKVARPHVPARSAGEFDNRIREAAALKLHPDREKYFSADVLEAADRTFRKAVGPRQLIYECAVLNGYHGRAYDDLREQLEFAFRPNLRGGWSLADISGILSNVANKFLLQGFSFVENTWRNVSAIRAVRDFKTNTLYRLTGAGQFEEVAPGGELKHGTLGEEAYTIAAKTYGLMYSISREMLVNDDLGPLSEIPAKLGRGAALKLNDVFWTAFLNNANFFTAARGNYAEGANTALSVSALEQAETLFVKQVDADGKPLGANPKILLVPPELNVTASTIYKSAEVRDNAAAKYPTSNPYAGRFQVEMSRYLSMTGYAGSSAKAWYLLADPLDIPVIEVAFLNGQQAPTIETAEADFLTLGIQMRGYFDFGVALKDYRGGVKMKGEA